MAIESDLPGMYLSNCSYMQMPWLGPPEQVSKCVKDAFAKEGMAPPAAPGVTVDGPSCSRSGNFDVWTTKVVAVQENRVALRQRLSQRKSAWMMTPSSRRFITMES